MKKDLYREKLSSLEDWEPFLRQESGLPGPRGNLELAEAVADVISPEKIDYFLSFTPERAPENTPEVFLAFCGVAGLGRLAANGDASAVTRLRGFASDPRWRIREAVAMALQRLGKAGMDGLIGAVEPWIEGNWLEMRAVAAGLAEPILLQKPEHIQRVLGILDKITGSMHTAKDRKSEQYKVLRQGMGYCWSVVVAALPDEGKEAMEKWLPVDDPDIRWMMKENLKKNRLVKMDSAWVERWNSHFQS